MTFVLHLLGVLLLLVASCSISGPLREDRSASGYHFPEPLKGWEKRDPREGAELLYLHRKSGAYLSITSLCDRYEESSLDTLAMSALAAVENLKEIERKSFLLDGREAVELYVLGKVDGVPVQVNLVTFRKNDCLFDFSLQGASLLTPETRAEFLRMVKGFRY